MKHIKNKTFKFQGKSFVINDFHICQTLLSKTIGLMFKKNPKNLLFIFEKPVNISIHSFFCRKKFVAIWLLKGRVIDAKIVFPWKLNITPRKKFDKLLELPFNDITEISRFSSLLERFKY
jgi:uncharacterized membrane protein (UPF0127 family)